MRTSSLLLSFTFLFAASARSSQANTVKLCVSQDAEGYDALRLARELSSRKLKSGVSLAVVAITERALPAEEQRNLAYSGTSFARLLLTERSAKAWNAEIERLGCDYNIKIWYHKSVDDFDTNSPAGLPSPMPGASGTQPIGDRAMVGYELRKAGSKKVLARASAPPINRLR